MTPIVSDQLSALIDRKLKEAGVSRGKHTIVIDKKTGLPKALDKTPRTIRKAKRNKTARAAKAWAKAGRKTT